jgi:hypothetical protein
MIDPMADASATADPRDSAEQGRGQDVHLRKAATDASDAGHRETHQLLGDAAVEHDLAGIDKKRNGE